MTRRLRLGALLLWFGVPAAAQVPPHLPALDRALPARAESIYGQLAKTTDAKVAMDVVAFMTPLWRLAGNPAFEQSQQFIFERLAAAGLQPKYEEYPKGGQGWEYVRGTVRLGGPSGEILLSKDAHRVPLAINSFSTAPGGVTLRLVDAGAGTTDAAYEGKDGKGAVVLASGSLGQAWNAAARARGAAGVISTEIAPYTKPAETPDVLQWGSIPYVEALRGFDPAIVRGSFLNDLHLAVALRRARDTNWVVRTNPYEGGSDHTVFTTAGVPSLLNWHFTDRYYHTNLDTIDKVSAPEMQNVAVLVGTTSLFLASAGRSDVAGMIKLLETARDARLATEQNNNATPEILQAWRKWYGEAIASVTRLAN